MNRFWLLNVIQKQGFFLKYLAVIKKCSYKNNLERINHMQSSSKGNIPSKLQPLFVEDEKKRRWSYINSMEEWENACVRCYNTSTFTHFQ